MGNVLAEIGRNVLADLVTVTKSASQEICWQKWGRGKSAGRFSGLSSNLSVRKSAGRNCRRNLLADLVTVTTSASKEIYCRNWEAVNLLGDLVTLTKSASQQYQQAEMVEESAGRFSDCHYICQLGNLQQEIGWRR